MVAKNHSHHKLHIAWDDLDCTFSNVANPCCVGKSAVCYFYHPQLVLACNYEIFLSLYLHWACNGNRLFVFGYDSINYELSQHSL